MKMSATRLFSVVAEQLYADFKGSTALEKDINVSLANAIGYQPRERDREENDDRGVVGQTETPGGVSVRSNTNFYTARLATRKRHSG
jgi:hypothetical protein